MKHRYTFPKGFWWGAASSGPQAEGRFNKVHRNIFDYWYDNNPEDFFNQVGPNTASNFYNSYKDDLAMLNSIGLNSLRTSIQWTRLIKDFETGEPDEDGVRFYNDVINECIKNGITPVLNLNHFDIPIELQEKYSGWESKHVVELFVKFAKTAFRLFSDRVKHWVTFNEPIVVVEGFYLYKFYYPKLVDGKKAVQVLFNLNLASAKVIKAYKEDNFNRDNGKIGIILNLTPSYPRNPDNIDDLKASQFSDDFFNNSFLEPAVRGTFPENLVKILEQDNVLWEATEAEYSIIKNNAIDFLGVNYYHPRRVKAKEVPFDCSQGWMPDKYFDNYIMPNRRMNTYRGWEIYPQCIYDIAINIRDNYNNIPWYISENGMGVEGEEKYINEEGVIEDTYRIEFYKEHLEYLYRGIEEGANCFGFHGWTPIDCWSWANAYKNRYGFIAVDLENQKKTIKRSGQWIKEVSKNNGF